LAAIGVTGFIGTQNFITKPHPHHIFDVMDIGILNRDDGLINLIGINKITLHNCIHLCLLYNKRSWKPIKKPLMKRLL
jgi:hypothetical protein